MSKTYTQDELNKLMAEARRAGQQELEIEKGKAKAARDELTDKLTSLGIVIGDGETPEAAGERWVKETEARIAILDAELANPQVDTELAELRDRADKAESRLKDVLIDSALTRAAAEMRAFRPQQVADLLKPYSKVIGDGEVVIDGYSPTLFQSPAEAVAMLHDDPANWNLFKDGKPPE